MADIITEGQRILAERWPTANYLRREFPYMGDNFRGNLRGDFATDSFGRKDFNVYEQGKVVSRTLIQSPPGKNPTVGVILPGNYSFPTGNNTETLTILDGELEASVNEGPCSILKRDGTIIAPAGTNLHLAAHYDPVFYICRYEPKISAVNDT